MALFINMFSMKFNNLIWLVNVNFQAYEISEAFEVIQRIQSWWPLSHNCLTF